ncbi:uncharacterized protein LOC144447520 [Glandiceps talaboti]
MKMYSVLICVGVMIAVSSAQDMGSMGNCGRGCETGKCDYVGYAYHCSCPEDRTGVYCETEKMECNSGECMHYGYCAAVTDGQYTCICTGNYTGPYCETYRYCNDYSCNGGTCDHGYCHCPEGRTGVFCENEVENRYCNDYSCNGGTCGYNGYCYCPEGRTGVFCENEVEMTTSCYQCTGGIGSDCDYYPDYYETTQCENNMGCTVKTYWDNYEMKTMIMRDCADDWCWDDCKAMDDCTRCCHGDQCNWMSAEGLIAAFAPSTSPTMMVTMVMSLISFFWL